MLENSFTKDFLPGLGTTRKVLLLRKEKAVFCMEINNNESCYQKKTGINKLRGSEG